MLYFGTLRDQMIEDVHGMSFRRRPKEGRIKLTGVQKSLGTNVVVIYLFYLTYIRHRPCMG